MFGCGLAVMPFIFQLSCSYMAHYMNKTYDRYKDHLHKKHERQPGATVRIEPQRSFK